MNLTKKNHLVINHKKQIPERHREVDCNSAAVLRYSLKNTKKFINNLVITHSLTYKTIFKSSKLNELPANDFPNINTIIIDDLHNSLKF